MPSLKDLKDRITSVRSTQKITKAMQMVAAAKLRRAEEAATAARPYAQRIETVLGNLAAGLTPGAPGPKLLTGTGKDQVHLLVVATADRGLCGGFNSSIVRLARERIVSLQGQGKTVRLFTIGKKGRDQLKRLYGDLILEHYDTEGTKTVGFEQAKDVADRLLALYEEGAFDVATIFYGRFQSVIAQVPTASQVIPAKPPARPQDAAPVAPYEYEPDEEAILTTLLPRYVAVQVFRALLENAASEQGARMSAMDNATRNAGEMIDTLNLQYNRARQAQITTELVEIIAGAESV
ncbi:F0F1 ATP synthase subunit gamma [Parvularcula dongshanensis]|uniref:ATP synthase gamma chain n=1 Tax=Parvularcula dongshanensis TaxID=1173995 RepID=A0A840I0I6_9PROT|nr:F0F1 ATP synthase subunit gamma [Parvularcula dongshanensis]MBB4657754.1 F-type H+-transporting ATPase subunit gamma [Parvularcula dongshanensis]